MLYSLLEHLAVIFLEGKFAKEHWFHMCSCIFQNIDCSNKTLIHENPLVNKFYTYNLWKLSTLTLALSWGWRDDSVVKNTGCFFAKDVSSIPSTTRSQHSQCSWLYHFTSRGIWCLPSSGLFSHCVHAVQI